MKLYACFYLSYHVRERCHIRCPYSCSAKERILAHSKEQGLEIPVMVTERNSVAVEDVASMLDKVLITSSNNADDVCDLQDALAVAKSDASTLREDLAAWKSHSASWTASEHTAVASPTDEVRLSALYLSLSWHAICCQDVLFHVPKLMPFMDICVCTDCDTRAQLAAGT